MSIHPMLRAVAAMSLPLIAFTVFVNRDPTAVRAAGPTRFAGPTSSQTLALSADDAVLAVVNPDNNSVSFFDTRPGTNQRIAEVRVGVEPNSVALTPDGTRAYIANTVSGTVTVMDLDRFQPAYGTTVTTIPVGTEPYGLALTPSARKLYVANARSNSVSVIDTTTNRVIKTITDVGFEPRGIAITNAGAGDDTIETVFVTQFLALPAAAGKIDGTDDAKTGRVTVISAASDTVTGEIALNPIADTGFAAAGDSLQRIAPPAAPVAADFKFITGAYPNQLNNIAIRGKFAFVPSTGASPNGPLRFDVNTQSLLSAINLTSRTDANRTINMHSAVAKQTGTPKRFLTQPWAVAFKTLADEGYVISTASNVAVKVKIDPATGGATVQNDPADATRVLQIPTGKQPRGIVVNSTDTMAFVMNYVSRDVTVIDLSGSVERVIATLSSAALPTQGSADDAVHIGKELYHSSVGVFDPPAAGQPAITGRMSNNGWGSCGSCHPFGLSDNVVWIFGAGPRRTIPQHADFAPGDPTTLRALNWSAIFDEEEDFESNIRGTSGGAGLLVSEDGITADPALGAFTPASGGRRQLKVRGQNAWDSLKAYIAKGIRSPISPVLKTDPDVLAGRQLFIQNNCQNCHGGSQWTTSRVRAAAPPDASMVVAGQLLIELRPTTTFDANAFNEVRANATPSLGAAGYNPPTLLSLFAFPQTFFHNGSVNSLDAVMQNVAHRSSGTGGVDGLQSAAQRAQLIRFLLSIDAGTVPINPAAPGALRTISAASYGGIAVAPESAAAAFGDKLAGQVISSPSPQLSPTLGGSTLTVRDSAGVLRLSRLFFVSPGQINFEVPAATATGNGTVTVYTGTGATSTGPVAIRNAAPGIFAASGNGAGVAAALAVRISADGVQTPVSVFQCDAAGKCVAAPIPMGAATDQVFVSLFGTGIRKRTSLDNVSCTIGGVAAPVAFAGPQGLVGLDQVNIQIPASLRGRGEAPVLLTVDGETSNPVTLNVQ
ncbi:MAG: hypothetical protein ACKV2U_06680 [Bryobacteraceae bacterium]